MINNLYIICFNRKVYHFVGKLSDSKKLAWPLCNNIAAHGTDHSESHLQTFQGGSPQGKIINYIPKNRNICKNCAKRIKMAQKYKSEE